MKVLIINSVCGRGSTGRIATDLHDVLIRDGHECKIAFGVGDASRVRVEDAVCINNQLGYYIHNALSRVTDRAGFYSVPQTARLIRWMKKYDPDVIHINNLHGFYINVKMLFEYLMESNKPVIWTLHDCWPMTGHCTHFQVAQCDKWKTGCFYCPQKREYPKSYVMDYSRGNYLQKRAIFTSVKNMVIITPSQWLGEVVKRSYLNKYRNKVISNGIDLAAFSYIESDIKRMYGIQNKIILGVANSWTDRKGFNDFIKLSKMLGDEYVIVLIGLKREQAKLLPGNMIGITRTSSIEELVKWYSAADVFVNLTYEDTFSMVNLEALACGTPVITYRSGGSPETVDERSGIVVDIGDLEGVCSMIMSMPAFKKEDILERAHGFDKNKKFQDYIAVYREICSM